MSNYTHFTDMTYAYDPAAPQQFQNYDQFQSYDQFYDNIPPPPATGEMQTSSNQSAYLGTDSSDPYANEPPLMEELEINLEQIMQKTWAVLSFKNLNDNKNILHEPDFAGPLVFLLAFGFLLLLSGKIHFGYLYGIGMVGCVLIYFVVKLMSTKGLSLMCTVSVLGYCLLPMVMLSALSILVSLKATAIGIILSVVAISWCTIGASNLLVTALEVTNSRLLIAYPCGLFYTVFALLTIF